MKNVLITLKNKIVVISLVLCIFLIPTMVFATDPDTSGSVSEVPYLAPDLESVKLYSIAEEIYESSDTKATTYTVTDIYNLLNSIRVTASGQYKFNVQDTTTHNYLLTLRNHIDDIFGYNTAYNYHDLVLQIWNILGGSQNQSLYSYVQTIGEALQPYIVGGAESYTLTELVAGIYGIDGTPRNLNSLYNRIGTVNTSVTNGNTILSSIDSRLISTNSNLSDIDTSINNIGNINWNSINITYNGASNDYDTNYFTSNTNSSDVKVSITIPSGIAQNSPSIYRLYLPFYVANSNNNTNIFELKEVRRLNSGSYSSIIYPKDDIFIENTYNGIYIYLLNFNHYFATTYYFNIVNNTAYTSTYNINYTPTLSFVSFDTYDYQLIKDAFYMSKQGEGVTALKKLADLYASDDLIQAKAAQQDYEDGVIEDFTGSGSAASTSSDKNGLKSVSSNIKSGLNTGGSINNALGVFNTSNSLWQFFTTTTQNNVDTRSGSNSRSINLRDSNDIILDFQTERDREYYSHLGE